MDPIAVVWAAVAEARPRRYRGHPGAAPAEAWVGVSLPPRTVLADLDLWLAARLGQEHVVLPAQEDAVESGIVTPSWPYATRAGSAGIDLWFARITAFAGTGAGTG